MNGHVLHRARAHLKVPGFSLVLNALLTKKLPMFLLRLNEINGGSTSIGIILNDLQYVIYRRKATDSENTFAT